MPTKAQKAALAAENAAVETEIAAAAAELAAAAETAPATNAPSTPIFTVGKTPRLGNDNMHDTARTWIFMVDHLADHGPQTVEALQKLVKEQYNHASFIKYAVKNGWLVQTTLEAEQAKLDALVAAAELAKEMAEKAEKAAEQTKEG